MTDFNDTVVGLTTAGLTIGLAAGIVNMVDNQTNKKRKKKSKSKSQNQNELDIGFF